MPRGKIKFTKEDREWAKSVKERDNHQCVICGDTKMLNAHHLFPREIKELKHDIDNGISLCPRHHRYSRQISAHQNPIAFQIWLMKNKQEQFNKLLSKWQELHGIPGK